MENDEMFMRQAIKEAEKAAKINEVPVGAVVVCDGEIVSAEFNTRETDKNALCHAEIKAINAACKKLGGWRLHKCDIYVTLEPCPMCAGAIINSRISAVIYGAADKERGCFGSVINMAQMPLGANPAVTAGVLAEECGGLLTAFFDGVRKNIS